MAHPAVRSSRQAAVTVRTSQPTRSAIVARVMATWRPVAWSAYSAITAATASSVAASIFTAADSLAAAKPAPFAHRRSADSQPARLVHIGARGATAPACTTQPRQRVAAAARFTAAAPREGFAAAENADRGRGEHIARWAKKWSRFTHPLRAASSSDRGCALP